MPKVQMILKLAQLFFAAGRITPNKGDLILLTEGAKVVYCGNGWYQLTHSYTASDLKDFVHASSVGYDRWLRTLDFRKKKADPNWQANR